MPKAKEFKKGDKSGDFTVYRKIGSFRYTVLCGCGDLYVRTGKELAEERAVTCMACHRKNKR